MNKISTVFGRDNFDEYIKNQIRNKNLVRIKNKSNQTSERNALIAKGYDEVTSNDIVSQNIENTSGKQQFSLSEVPLQDRVSGDALLDAEDLIVEIGDMAEISENGYVTLYHRTSKENANNIRSSKKMSAKEDGIFFSTKKDGQNAGYGEEVIEFKIPIEKLVLDDIFDDEAHLRFPLKNRNQILDVSDYLADGNTKMSLSKNEDIAPIGNYNVYGKDIAFEAPTAEDIAMSQENVSKNQDTIGKIAPPTAEDLEKQSAAVRDYSPNPENWNKPIETVKDRNRAKLENLKVELEKKEEFKKESHNDFNKEIADLQQKCNELESSKLSSYNVYTDKLSKMRLEYDSKKNKETKVANELKSRIIRTEALKESIQSQYDNDINIDDYICITDIAAAKSDNSRAADVIRNWLRNRSTLEFLSTWEEIYNPDFKVFESEHFKKEAGLVTFTPSVSEWVDKTSAVGLYVKRGKYGGTFAHKDIAFEFASAISPVFKLYLIKEFQRLKEAENNLQKLEWDAKRFLSKNNYLIQTDAVKNYLIPVCNYSEDLQWLPYAEEADLLNVALFGFTAKAWREANPELAIRSNVRDYATINELTVLSNLESHNAQMIREGMDKKDRFEALKEVAKYQLSVLNEAEKINNRIEEK